ncbi:MAG: aspartate/glutamate racemase family protein [Chlamydiia bacterium]
MSHYRPKIGIIGGAGPIAGALLFEKIIESCQRKYGCTHDADFPYCLLLNYPFSDVLGSKIEQPLIESQLHECFSTFSRNEITIVAIACNTLHAFLPSIPENIQLVHLIEETGRFLALNGWKNPLVLCTSTSAKTELHARYFPSRYLEPKEQAMIDLLVDQITIGKDLEQARDLINQLQIEGPLILGCTELSLLNDRYPLRFTNLIDPNQIVAKKICELHFEGLVTVC